MTQSSIPSEISRSAKALWTMGPGKLELREESVPSPGPKEVLVRTLYSAVSLGTERLVFSGRIPESEWSRMRAPFQAGAEGVDPAGVDNEVVTLIARFLFQKGDLLRLLLCLDDAERCQGLNDGGFGAGALHVAGRSAGHPSTPGEADNHHDDGATHGAPECGSRSFGNFHL